MKKGLTEIILVVDRSSSMHDVRMTTINGLKEFLKEQKSLPGNVRLTYITFSSDYKVEFQSTDIQTINSEIFDSYVPSGMTALLDAIGIAIDSTGKMLANTPEEERPEKVMVIILTDGEENRSVEYKLKDVKEKVEHQKNVYKWEFLFLGADIDAISAGYTLNMGNSSVRVNKYDMGKTMKAASVYSGIYRSADLSNADNEFSTVSTQYFNYTEEELNKEINNLKNANK